MRDFELKCCYQRVKLASGTIFGVVANFLSNSAIFEIISDDDWGK